MTTTKQSVIELPAVSRTDFDIQSGSVLEKLVFNHRGIIIVLCALVTLVLGYQATKIRLDPGFAKMLPQSHEYVRNFVENRNEMAGMGDMLRLVVSTEDDTIYTPEFLNTLDEINQKVFLTPGVDRSAMRSIFTPNTRWVETTPDGFDGGTVIPNRFDASSPEKIGELEINIQRAGIIGNLVGNNHRSATILIPLLSTNPKTGERLNYYKFVNDLEAIRAEYEQPPISVHITGFAKIVGELIDGLLAVMAFFAIAVVIAGLLLYLYSRCLRSTLMVIASSIIAIVWQLGILASLGYSLDPYSILVPFLVFAIGVSHGAQKLNGILQDIGRGSDRYVAARYTFRRLFLPGVTALLSDGVGFAVLMIIQIPVIQDLAITASVGVLVLIFTNLILFPVVLSYFGVTKKAVQRAQRPMPTMESSHGLWRFLLSFTQRGRAITAIVIAALMAVGGFMVSQNLQIGDLDPGAPELRANSRYNQDVRYINDNYSTSSDIFVVIVRSPADGCIDYEALSLADELEARLREVQGVEDVRGLNSLVRQTLLGLSEGYIKFNALFRNQDTINYGVTGLVPLGFVNTACSHWPMLIYLADHKAATLQRVVETLDSFNADFQTPKVEFLGAAGNAGFEAATNIVVKKANRDMLFYVYAAVTLLCLLTFRSIAAVICAVLPLMLTSILCEALMVWLGIGVKVATLPVIALGVGIGIDYALYVLSVMLQGTRAGLPVREAYFGALNATGKVVALIGVTLAAGVVTWTFSPIKFQADMGILLAFMFLWNMVGALILMPALAHFLLQPKARQSID